jgi:hypothetical protein
VERLNNRWFDKWIRAEGVNRGYPTVAVVGDDRRLLWVGMPGELEEVLKLVLSSQYTAEDLSGWKNDILEHIATLKKINAAIYERKDVVAAVDSLLKARPYDAVALQSLRFKAMALVEHPGAAAYLEKLLQQKTKYLDWTEVAGAASLWAQGNPSRFDLALRALT